MENKPNIVFVPWYIKTAIDAIGVDLTTLTNDLTKTDTPLDKMSKDDLKDFVAINLFMQDYFFIGGEISESDSAFHTARNYTGREIIDAISKDVINVLSADGKVEIKNTIIMTYENNTVYVILQEGFSNFIKFNDKTLEKELINEIINFAFKYFKSIDIYDSRYFKKFLTLNKTK